MIHIGCFEKIDDYEQAGLIPVSICAQKPCWFDGYHFPFFAPSMDMFLKWKNEEIDDNTFITRFTEEVLNKLDKNEVEEKLTMFEDLILVGYEKEVNCHLYIVSKWIKENLNMEVKEFVQL